MSATAVFRRDFLDVRRAKLVWLPAALYTLFMLLFFWGQSGGNPGFDSVLFVLGTIGGVLVIPLIAMIAAYLSIAGERESGRITFSLGVPVDRLELVVGKFAARSLVVVAGIVVSFAVGLAAARFFIPEMSFDVGTYLGFMALLLLYSVAYVAIAVGISASTASRSRAMGGAIGFFFVFNIVWNFLPVSPAAMIQFVFDELGVDYSQNFIDFILRLSPTGAFVESLSLVLTGIQSADPADPFYLQEWFMIVIMAMWVVVPLALGYWRFRGADLS